MSELAVVFVDDTLLVLDKPAGLLSVPGRGEDKQDCLSRRAQQHFPDALVVHRLDMATSGLLVMARGTAAQRSLNDAFAARSVQKRYEAVVEGVMDTTDDASQLIDLPIFLDWPNRPKRIIDSQHGKPSTTRWQVLATNPINGTSRVALEPITGRSHQLRVHLQAIGHAILGDQLYASPEVAARCNRLLLHACALELTHPADLRPMHFVSPTPF
ncbi:MAG: pseudouridine synthase [Rhodoferax sp.]|uniref:RluA family pseudouridine synthase n=1 Tax=Rhodoferax sp. TaxID=50421 RepID=UPI00262AD52E|nr:pseudouridine synthase [Rhodoferax sp.]MDD2883002.1 pseudouridine synthase [Rhodoferax sp.]